MRGTFSKLIKPNLIMFSSLIISLNAFGLGVEANSTPTTAKGNLGEYADEYTVEYDFGGQLTTNTLATLKFNSSDDIEVSGTIKINTIATLMFDSNPYRIVYEKGLSDDLWKPNSDKPSPGYPKDTEMVFNNTTGQKFRSYYEDNKERLGRSYKIRFDSNDANDGNGSTIATLVDITKTEVPTIESLDYKNTGKYKQSITEKTSKINITFNNGLGTSILSTEDRGFNGTLFFKHWSVYNQMLKKYQNFQSLAAIPANSNFTGDFGGKVVATAIWENRTFVYGKDFSDVTRTGYNFMGWKSLREPSRGLINTTNKNYTVYPCPGNSQNDYSKSADYSSYVDVLQAQWTPKKYRLILDGNQPEGTHTYDMKLVAFDSKVGTLPTPVISIPNSQYKFKGWFTAKEGGKPVDFTLPWTYNHGMIIYAHWEKDEHKVGEDPDIDPDVGDYDYLVPESQIVRAVELSDTDKAEMILADHYWYWSYEITCPGHTFNGETYYCAAFNPEGVYVGNSTFNNSNYKRFIANVNPWYDYSYILEQANSFNNEDVIDDDYSGIPNGTPETGNSDKMSNLGEVKTKHNYDIAFHRGKDSLTLANWINVKNGITVNSVDVLNNFLNANISSGTRTNNGFYKENATIKFRGNTDNSLLKTSVEGEGVCSNGGGTVTIKSGNFDESITVAYKVYKGVSSNTPNASGSKKNNTNTSNGVESQLTLGTDATYYASGDRIPSGVYNFSNKTLNNLTVEFYPYIRMRYDTLDKNGTITLNNDVYVLGEYKRKIAFSDYAEVIYEKAKGYKETADKAGGFTLKIESSQWLTDIETKDLRGQYSVSGLKGEEKFDYENVLPGGATLSLSTSTDIRQYVTVRTYQVTLSTAGKEQVEKTGGKSVTIPTSTTMRDTHNRYVKTVLNGLDNMEITQWQYYNGNLTDLKKVHSQWVNGDIITNPGVQVYAGADYTSAVIDGMNPQLNKQKLSTNSKYYFRDFINGEQYASKENRNDLDARMALNDNGTNKGERYTVYRFSVDTSGNIWVEAFGSDSISKKILLTQEQDESALPDNSLVKDVNDKTLVITKLRDALEYNSGDDNGATWVSDGDWYNEAFDGVEVHVFENMIETGLIDSNARTQVFDPLLNTYSSGTQSNFSTFALNQFRIQNYSNLYGKDKLFQIGEYKGEKVHMMNMETLYVSKPFYNTNITVQDKN